MAAEPSLFQRITDLSCPRSKNRSLDARWQPSVAQCVEWLELHHLTREVRTYQPPQSPSAENLLVMGDRIQFGIPCQRAERLRKADLDALRKQYLAEHKAPALSPAALDAVWKEYKDPKGAIKMLDIQRLPADALAFYRPFHFAPYDEWGIYLMVDRLLRHCRNLSRAFKDKLWAFNFEALLGCVLFEVFHHEFFHHQTECAATTIEILSAAFGPPRPVYNEYWNNRYEQSAGLGRHPDHPLEEALANAYAYNSFSFLSRTQIGYKLVWVKLYQSVLEKCWPLEPPGYRSAASYIKGGYVDGGAQLLAMLGASADLDPASLLLLAKTVLPNGNSAFLQKPDVPTYLVGDEAALKEFRQLVPTPNETYTSLYWLGDTSPVDNYLQKRKQEEAASKSKKKPDQVQLF